MSTSKDPTKSLNLAAACFLNIVSPTTRQLKSFHNSIYIFFIVDSPTTTLMNPTLFTTGRFVGIKEI